jgi:hypothetical protein
MQNNVFAFPILTGFNCPVQPWAHPPHVLK